MTVKILVNSLGQHTIADVRQVSNKETEEIVAYWVKEPRNIVYRQAEDGNGIAIDFSPTCPVAVTTEYAIRADFVVSILDPIAEVEQKYVEVVNNVETDTAVVPAEEPVAEAPAEEAPVEEPAAATEE